MTASTKKSDAKKAAKKAVKKAIKKAANKAANKASKKSDAEKNQAAAIETSVTEQMPLAATLTLVGVAVFLCYWFGFTVLAGH